MCANDLFLLFVSTQKFIFSQRHLETVFTPYYNMTESVSGQDEANPAFWLATRAGKIDLSCPLGISRVVPARKSSVFGHIINPLLTKLIRIKMLVHVYWSRRIETHVRTGPIFSHLDTTLGQWHICIFLIIFPRVRVGYELPIIISYPISAKGIIVLLKTPTKYRKFFLTLFVKTTDFQLVFNFEQTRTVTIFGEYGMMAKLIRAL